MKSEAIMTRPELIKIVTTAKATFVDYGLLLPYTMRIPAAWFDCGIATDGEVIADVEIIK